MVKDARWQPARENQSTKRESQAVSKRSLLIALIVLSCVAMVSCSLASPCDRASSPTPAAWMSAGGDLHDTRSQCSEVLINSSNVSNLTPLWVQATAGDVSATPTTDGTNLYFPDWGGNLNALRAETGDVIWQRPISSYNGIPETLARSSPALADQGKALIFGDIASKPGTGPGAHVIKVDAITGAMIWITNVDSHPAAMLSANPVVVDNTVIVGVGSSEEGFAVDPNYPCCNFRGSVVALDETTGTILWKTFLVPDNGGALNQYSGAGIWGGTPMIDEDRGLVYVGTGNNYTIPQDAAACLLLLPDSTTCTDPGNHIDSVVALELGTGNIRWSFQARASDISTNGCSLGVNCESPRGPDHDFAQGPIFVQSDAAPLIFAGQKSGVGFALNPDTGEMLWETFVGSGMVWGSATDGRRIYVGTRSNIAGDVGAWTALDPSNGYIVWSTNVPGSVSTRARATGPVAVANGVVYGGSTSTEGETMFALDADNGNIVFSFNSGSPVQAGATIVGGTVYWGTGYPSASEVPGPSKIFAFHLPN